VGALHDVVLARLAQLEIAALVSLAFGELQRKRGLARQPRAGSPLVRPGMLVDMPAVELPRIVDAVLRALDPGQPEIPELRIGRLDALQDRLVQPGLVPPLRKEGELRLAPRRVAPLVTRRSDAGLRAVRQLLAFRDDALAELRRKGGLLESEIGPDVHGTCAEFPLSATLSRCPDAWQAERAASGLL